MRELVDSYKLGGFLAEAEADLAFVGRVTRIRPSVDDGKNTYDVALQQHSCTLQRVAALEIRAVSSDMHPQKPSGDAGSGNDGEDELAVGAKTRERSKIIA